jgi:hypothetical protein
MRLNHLGRAYHADAATTGIQKSKQQKSKKKKNVNQIQ